MHDLLSKKLQTTGFKMIRTKHVINLKYKIISDTLINLENK